MIHFALIRGYNHDIIIKLDEPRIQPTEKTKYMDLIFH